MSEVKKIKTRSSKKLQKIKNAQFQTACCDSTVAALVDRESKIKVTAIEFDPGDLIDKLQVSNSQSARGETWLAALVEKGEAEELQSEQFICPVCKELNGVVVSGDSVKIIHIEQEKSDSEPETSFWVDLF